MFSSLCSLKLGGPQRYMPCFALTQGTLFSLVLILNGCNFSNHNDKERMSRQKSKRKYKLNSILRINSESINSYLSNAPPEFIHWKDLFKYSILVIPWHFMQCILIIFTPSSNSFPIHWCLSTLSQSCILLFLPLTDPPSPICAAHFLRV